MKIEQRVFVAIMLLGFAVVFSSCQLLGREKTVHAKTPLRMAVYEHGSLRVVAYMESRFISYKLGRTKIYEHLVTLYLQEDVKVRANKFYTIKSPRDAFDYSIYDIYRFDEESGVLRVMKGAILERMNGNEDFLFSYDIGVLGSERYFDGSSRFIFHEFRLTEPTIVNMTVNGYRGFDSNTNDWKKIKKLRVEMEYYENDTLLEDYGFKTIFDLNQCAYAYQSRPLKQSMASGEYEINWEDMTKEYKKRYTQTLKLLDLFRKNRKVMVFEFDVDFMEDYRRSGLMEL